MDELEKSVDVKQKHSKGWQPVKGWIEATGKKKTLEKSMKIQEKFSSLELLMTDDARTAYGEVK